MASGVVEVIRGWRDLPASQRGAAVAVGAFDGVHRGHQAVIASAREAAQRLGAPLGVVTVVFGAVHAHADDQAVEQRQCAPHDVVVADGEWVERPGE